uniref:GDSL esterase/lipase n=1 Tax=Zea mays TaxID=4577 RepID=A0A804PZT5_MAIZE
MEEMDISQAIDFIHRNASQGGTTLPMIYVLGDSLAPVENNNNLVTLLKANFLRNNIDYLGHKATGCFSNGKNSIDFLGRSSLNNHRETTSSCTRSAMVSTWTTRCASTRRARCIGLEGHSQFDWHNFEAKFTDACYWHQVSRLREYQGVDSRFDVIARQYLEIVWVIFPVLLPLVCLLTMVELQKLKSMQWTIHQANQSGIDNNLDRAKLGKLGDLRNSWNMLSKQYKEEYEKCIEESKSLDYDKLYKGLEVLADLDKHANSTVIIPLTGSPL